MTDALVPLTVPPAALARTRSIGELLEHAAQDMPQLAQDGVRVSAHIDGRGTSVVGIVQVRDFSGTVVARRTYDGQKEISGAITWRWNW